MTCPGAAHAGDAPQGAAEGAAEAITMAPEQGGCLSVDLDALVANYRTLQRQAAPAETAAVVKADAYGLGVGAVARALAGAGCGVFFVARMAEGRALRRILADTHAANGVIYVMDGLLPGTAALCAAHDLRPCLGSLEELAAWTAFCTGRGEALAAAVHLDTGINRLGFSMAEAAALAQAPELLRGCTIALVMSHLACSGVPADPMNRRQLEAFNRLRLRLRLCDAPLAASLANTGGIALGPGYHLDMVRPGLGLYGGAPDAGDTAMQPVASLSCRVLQVRDVAPGDPVGYGARWRSRRPSRIATIAAGYADGLPRNTDGGGGFSVGLGRHDAPLVGRISMDTCAADVTGIPAHLATPGCLARIIGPERTVNDLARAAGITAYDVLTSLGPRYERHYTGHQPPWRTVRT